MTVSGLASWFNQIHAVPWLHVFLPFSRDIRAHKRKVKKALAKKNRDLANKLLNRQPTYKLDRLILERFVDSQLAKYDMYFDQSPFMMLHLVIQVPNFC